MYMIIKKYKKYARLKDVIITYIFPMLFDCKVSKWHIYFPSNERRRNCMDAK